MRALLFSLATLTGAGTYAQAPAADAEALRKHVYALCDTPGYRNCYNIPRLDAAGAYILKHLKASGASVSEQPYEAVVPKAGATGFRNIIASYGPKDAPVIVVGAHYDVCGNQMGADDNASGVAALLELAGMLAKEDAGNWKYRLELVAFSTEEPPFFDEPGMGSYVHAKSLAADSAAVRGMISLEMLGFYRDEKHSQGYPIGLLRWFYGSRGNYITVVHQLHKGAFVRSFQRGFKRGPGVRVKKFGAPRALVGINLSDHFNYWDHGWPALMITNTSFYRNANYHRSGDTPETLDYKRMAAVTDKVYRALMRQVRR